MPQGPRASRCPGWTVGRASHPHKPASPAPRLCVGPPSCRPASRLGCRTAFSLKSRVGAPIPYVSPLNTSVLGKATEPVGWAIATALTTMLFIHSHRVFHTSFIVLSATLLNSRIVSVAFDSLIPAHTRRPCMPRGCAPAHICSGPSARTSRLSCASASDGKSGFFCASGGFCIGANPTSLMCVVHPLQDFSHAMLIRHLLDNGVDMLRPSTSRSWLGVCTAQARATASLPSCTLGRVLLLHYRHTLCVSSTCSCQGRCPCRIWTPPLAFRAPHHAPLRLLVYAQSLAYLKSWDPYKPLEIGELRS